MDYPTTTRNMASKPKEEPSPGEGSRVPQVQQQLNRLGEIISQLQNTTEELFGRLGSVCRSSPMTNAVPDKKQENNLAPMANEISVRADNASDVLGRLVDLLKLLEV